MKVNDNEKIGLITNIIYTKEKSNDINIQKLIQELNSVYDKICGMKS